MFAHASKKARVTAPEVTESEPAQAAAKSQKKRSRRPKNAEPEPEQEVTKSYKRVRQGKATSPKTESRGRPSKAGKALEMR